MPYIGPAVTQIDGSPYAQLNCVVAATSCLGDTSTLGYLNVSAGRLRVLTQDYSGGITYTDAAKAMGIASNNEVKLTVLYWAPENSNESTLNNILSAPRVTAISIEAGVTRYTPFRTGWFVGGHTVLAGGKRYAWVVRDDGTRVQQKQVLVMDPGHSNAKWEWWPWNLLIKAAKTRAGGDRIHVMYTRDLEKVVRVVSSDGPIRSSKQIANNKIGKVTKGQTLTVVATLHGDTWTVDGRTGRGWSKLGVGKYVSGGRLR